MSTHGGYSFPGLNTLFGRVHRVSHSLVPSFLRFVPSFRWFRSFVPSFLSFVPYLQIHHNREKKNPFHLTYSTFKSHKKMRYCNFTKSAQNHRSLTLIVQDNSSFSCMSRKWRPLNSLFSHKHFTRIHRTIKGITYTVGDHCRYFTKHPLLFI